MNWRGVATAALLLALAGCSGEESSEIRQCREAVMKHARHPSTVKVLSTSTDHRAEGGGKRIMIRFEASNTYGLVLTNEATCTYYPKNINTKAMRKFDVREVAR